MLEFYVLQRISIQFDVEREQERDDYDLDEEVATAAFRIAQECLTNVARHAQAGHVLVSLKCVDDKLMLRVSDDGNGISAANESKRNSFGIIGMRERAHGLGGTLNFSSVAGEGTRVDVVMPIKPVAVVEVT